MIHKELQKQNQRQVTTSNSKSFRLFRPVFNKCSIRLVMRKKSSKNNKLCDVKRLGFSNRWERDGGGSPNRLFTVPREAAVDVDGESSGEINGGDSKARRERLEYKVPCFARNSHFFCSTLQWTPSKQTGSLLPVWPCFCRKQL